MTAQGSVLPGGETFMQLREQRTAAAKDAEAFSRSEIIKRLRLRCLELALEAQRQNSGETLSTKELIVRSEAILSFVQSGEVSEVPQTSAISA